MKSDMLKGVIHDTKFGKLKVVEYRGALDVVVEFLETGYKTTSRADTIRNGQTKDKTKPIIFNVGFIGDGEFKSFLNKKRTVAYEKWYHMLERCYCEKHHARFPTYKDCSVDPEWHNFQNFAGWLHSHDFDVSLYELDKDGVKQGNRVYSPSTCKLISRAENIEISQSRGCKLLSPEGDVVEVFNLSKFSRENNLNNGSLSNLILGKAKSSKGWTLYHG